MMCQMADWIKALSGDVSDGRQDKVLEDDVVRWQTR